MATVKQYKAYDEVVNRVNDVRMRATLCRILDGVLGAVAVAGLVLLAVTGLQAAGRFGAFGREALRVILVAGVVVALARLALLVFRRQWTDEQAARFIETHVPEAGNNLINVVQLVRDDQRWSPFLLDRAVTEAARDVRDADLMRAVSWRRAAWFGVAAAVGAALLAAFAWGLPGEFTSALEQVLHPYDYVPTRTALALRVSPGNVSLLRGEPLRVEVRFDNPAVEKVTVSLLVSDGGDDGEERRLGMSPSDASRSAYVCELPEVNRPLVYRVEAGRSQSDRFTVTIRERPVVAALAVTYDYPDYTGLEPRIETGATGHVRAPVGTNVGLTVTTSGRVDGCTLRFVGRPDLACRLEAPDRTVWRAAWQVLGDDAYRIHVAADPATGGDEVEYTVEAVADAAPTVALPLPGREVRAPPGGKVKVLVRATDDYGFRSVRLFVHPDKTPTAAPARTWQGRDVAGRKSLALDYEIGVPADAALGTVLEYFAEATDNLVYQGGASPREPHVVRSDAWRIVVEDTAAVAQARLKEAQDLYGRLQKLLDSQKEARAWLGSLAGLSPDGALGRVRDVAYRQREIRAEAIRITIEVAFDRETSDVKGTLDLLIRNQMRQAEQTAGKLAEAAETRPDRALQHALAGTQNEIIVVLERLLDVARGRVKVAEAALGQEGTDLPADVAERLQQLVDKLKEFIDQQKKVIEETEKLAKKPVNDFTQEDRDTLAELAATEDQWAKFLADAISELSNLPVLDASNVSLLKELIEVKYDLEMAKDALKKDAVEIAVPLEAAGAELAEEIVENLERWLPDTPDRTKWSMEEPTEPMEIPNAELPEQLEDMVGELLEQEEDLFDEMEDATSGWADSMDKGAGWDAMDGPISNYSAKGVTGNQLPNTSEVGGRSGEGRTGKASGEMVEDTATGKGGRRTPTRVTADPFQTGEITDTSKDPPGGATGGGKVSGSGNEGLEGPVPRETERKMQRLAGRQADVRSRAEKINIDLKVSGYENFNLDEAIRSMRRVERELLVGRYRNAMREKHVLLNQLKSTGSLLRGDIHVRTDVRSNLPDEYRKEIEEASQAPMPEGYEALVKQYYERLSRGE